MLRAMILTLALLAGCIGAPDYYELTPYYGTLDLGQRDVDAVDQGLMFTLGWAPKMASHNSRMESYAIASLSHAGADPEEIAGLLALSNKEAPESVSADIVNTLAREPDTLDAAQRRLLWVASLVLAALGAVILWKSGLLTWLLPSKKEPDR